METKETQCHPKPLVNATCNLGAKGCYGNGKCHYIGNCEHKITTNADSIRAMSDKELEWTIDPAIVPPGMTKREWLRQPAEEG